MGLILHSPKFSQMNSPRIFTFFVQMCLILYKKYQIHRLCFLLTTMISLSLCFLFTIHDQRRRSEDLHAESQPTHIFYPNTSLRLPLSQVTNRSHHLILLWTDLFDNFYWHQPSFFNSSTIISCSPKHQCLFTRNKRRLSQASVVAFHLYDLNRYKLPERNPLIIDHQNWIFITGESPVNFYYQNPSFSPYMLDNYFDRSISYKFDSPYPVFASPIKARNLSSQQIRYEQQINMNNLKFKKKPIAWIVSNCFTFSQREKYVRELQKFIHVDVYGRCGTPCSNKDNRECQINLNEYYFYLAFENSRCKSYITEKFWNIISDTSHRFVPIVMGAEENDYEQIAPPQSFIHVNRFKTPKELAEYLHDLMKNPEKYLMYLQWREHMEVEVVSHGRWMNFLCPLCQMAEETRLFPHIRMNFSAWYNPKTACHADDVRMFKQCKQTSLSMWMSWTHNIRCP